MTPFEKWNNARDEAGADADNEYWMRLAWDACADEAAKVCRASPDNPPEARRPGYFLAEQIEALKTARPECPICHSPDCRGCNGQPTATQSQPKRVRR